MPTLHQQLLIYMIDIFFGVLLEVEEIVKQGPQIKDLFTENSLKKESNSMEKENKKLENLS